MRQINGTGNRILEVDLSQGTVKLIQVSDDLRRLYLGGKGLGLKLLHDRLTPGIDPLSPDNIIAFMPGVLMGTGAPCSGRFEALAKSPLTGIMGTSSCGGPFGMALKTAGWDGILIKGRAAAPTCLMIDENGVEFEDAADLWGLDIPQAQAKLDGKRRSSVVIGPAGENLARMANLASGHRFLGRGGLGAVMGSKRLKAVVTQGGAWRILPVDQERFAKVKKRATAYLKAHRITGHAYRDFGTAANVRMCQDGGLLPVRNFADGWDPLFDRISGETMAAEHRTSHHTCRPCTILCGHKGEFQGQSMAVPEYETVGLLGASLGVFDADQIAQWNQICGRLGLDTISAGGTIAWVMVAAERGLVDSELRFGSPRGVSQALEDMARGQRFGAEMALGSRALAAKYGGQEFAMQVKGLEMAAYDPRGSFGQGLAYAVANRGGCHLSAYLVAQEVFFGLLGPYSTQGKAPWVKFLEDLGCCINSLQTCQFTMYAYMMESPLTKYTPDWLLGPLMQYLPAVALQLVDVSIYQQLYNSVTGLGLGKAEFLGAGERIHVLERYMNTREGIGRRDDTLPGRLLTQGRASDPKKRTVPVDKMLPAYYKLRGYDDQGVPTPATLRRLKII